MRRADVGRAHQDAPGGAAARADQIATLVRVKHYRLAADEIGRLVDQLSGYEESLPRDSTEASLIRVARRDHEKARRVPPDLEAELARAAATGEHAWREARGAQATSACCCRTCGATSSCASATSNASLTWTTPTTCCSTTSSPG